MSGQLKTSSHASLSSLHSATSSPGSESGPTHFDVPAGLTAGQSGQALALASLSARQAKAVGLLTSGTCGRRGTTSSASAALVQSLASRLQARTALLGSTLFTLTWKQRVTPSGLSISALRASVRRTYGKDFTSQQTGWPTPTTRDHKDGNNAAGNNDSSRKTVALASWPTPKASDG